MKNDNNWAEILIAGAFVAAIFGAATAVLLIVASCATIPVETPKAPPAVAAENCQTIAGKKSCAWAPTWEETIRNGLTPGILSASPGAYCPNYSRLSDKSRFWINLFRATVRYESGFNPRATYTEKFIDHSTGKLSVSSGLLQLSIGDKSNYKGEACQKLTPESLFDPSINLACGTEIADALLAGKKPFKKNTDVRTSLGRYWSTIRDGKISSELKRLMPECY